MTEFTDIFFFDYFEAKKLKLVKSLSIDLMDQESQTFDIIWTVQFLMAFAEFWVDYFQPYK